MVNRAIRIFKQVARHKVFQFGAVYLGAAWLLLDLAIVLEETLELPNWVDRWALYGLVAGFPVALVLAWFIEYEWDEDDDTAAPAAAASQTRQVAHAHENPSVVVVPFRARLHDDVEALTAEGLTDEIASLLTHIEGLKIIPRLAMGRHLEEGSDPLAIAREFRADYLVSGSVRRDENRLRVHCQLTDLAEDNQIWSEKFDRTMEDMFAIQDEVARGVAGTLGCMIARLESIRAARRPPENLRAWELTRRAMEISFDWRPERMREGLRDCRRAIELDPNYGLAHAYLAVYGAWEVVQGWSADPQQATAEYRREADLALGLANGDAEVVSAVGETYRMLVSPRQAIATYESALATDADFFASWPFALPLIGWAYAQAGQIKPAWEYLARFEGKFPTNELGRKWSRVLRGYLEFTACNFETAVELLDLPFSEYNSMCRVVGLCCLDRLDEARAEFARLQAANPEISLTHYVDHFSRFHVDPEVGARMSAGLAKLKSDSGPDV